MDFKAFYKVTYGLYLLTAKDESGDNGCVINTVMQVANEPERIAISVLRANKTYEMIKKSGEFNVCALTEDTSFEFFTKFGMTSGRDADKFAGFESIARTPNGLVRLTKNSNMYLCAKVIDSLDIGAHTLFIAEVTEAEVLSDATTCTYEYYQKSIKPKPSVGAKKAWVCAVCGYVYEGEELPDDYECPLCHHSKADFVFTDATKAEPVQKKELDPSAKKWRCTICGEIVAGDEAPDQCPLCKAGKDKFEAVDSSAELVWAAEHIVGVANGAPAEIIEGLRANFMGECTEVGMYLAMARVAHREGYPEIGLYWEKAAYEEAEHAAKFAELLGEVVTDSTKKNLEMRVEAENGATLGKFELAKMAKELGLDAIHDTVHEMARDEARHGKAFEGLLNRYFK